MPTPLGSLIDGPCAPWDLQWCGGQPPDDNATFAAHAASEVLWALSGRRFGLCQWTERPCRRTAGDNWNAWATYTPPLWPLIRDFPFIVSCGTHPSDTCSCTLTSEIWLPGTVASVDEVKVNGVVLAPTAYRVDDAYKIIRTDGGTFPFCQDLTLADTEAGTMSVTFTTGLPIPSVGQLAAGELAKELYAACIGEPCKLSSRVSNLTRQGISMVLIDPQTFLDNGRVGLTICDMFLAAYNPNHLSSPPQVYSPDLPSHRLTW